MASSLLRYGMRTLIRLNRQALTKVSGTSVSAHTPFIRHASGGAPKHLLEVVEGQKVPYEIELEKIKKETNYQEHYGFNEHEPLIDKLYFHTLCFIIISFTGVFGGILMWYGPGYNNRMVLWRTMEAHRIIQESREKGVCPISPDFVPADKIESMVPPPGDWERDWLSKQPTTKPARSAFYQQHFTY